ncbi:probable apyrase 7 [Olea europaea subsp. europaea]|uniref:Probable apyrase 7 n=1 Tax=Olea europaea subsp. europaea TaxID=158383 RepID=A0A8S0QHR8_OLEEU|nr:probable apyrase 7 [Olea europaea subsp. europaea]
MVFSKFAEIVSSATAHLSIPKSFALSNKSSGFFLVRGSPRGYTISCPENKTSLRFFSSFQDLSTYRRLDPEACDLSPKIERSSGYGLNDAFDKSVAHLLRRRLDVTDVDLVSGNVKIMHPCLHYGNKEQYTCSHCAFVHEEGRSPARGDILGKSAKAGVPVWLVGTPNWASYVVLLLREGLHIIDRKVIIGSGSITWTIGVALLEAGKAFPKGVDFYRYKIFQMKINAVLLFAILFASVFVLVRALSCTGNGPSKFFRRPYLPLFRHNSVASTSVLNISSPFQF